MKRNDGLYRLIKSLTKSEKRFFKIYSSRHVIGGQNNYVDLFDAIDKQKVYDEAAIKEQFKAEKFVRRLSVAKSYLSELILKSMRSYHSQSTVDAQIMELLRNISFLFYKGLYDQAKKMINKAKKIALEHEKVTILPEIINWQKKIVENESFSGIKEKDVIELYEIERDLIAKWENLSDYWLLQAKLYVQHNQKGMVRNRQELQPMDEISKSPLANQADLALSYEAKGMYLKINATYYFILRDFPNCYQFIKQLVDHFEGRDDYLQANILSYVNSINNLLNITNVLGKSEENSLYLDKLQQMMQGDQLKKTQNMQIKLFEVYYYHSMTNHIRNNDYKNGMPYVPEVEAGLNQFEGKISKMGKIMMCFQTFHLCFGAKEYEQALNWLYKLLDNPDFTVREDVYCFAKILLPIVLFEKGDYEQMSREFKATYAYLYKRKSDYQFESSVLTYIRKTQSVTSMEDLPAYFQEVLEDLEGLLQDPFERKILAYFDFIAWLKAKKESPSPISATANY